MILGHLLIRNSKIGKPRRVEQYLMAEFTELFDVFIWEPFSRGDELARPIMAREVHALVFDHVDSTRETLPGTNFTYALYHEGLVTLKEVHFPSIDMPTGIELDDIVVEFTHFDDWL